VILPLADLPPTGPWAEPRPYKRGPYTIRDPKKALAVGAMDAALSLLPRRTPAPPRDPARILVANWAHLGDVVTSLGVLRALRERFPRAEIGMLVGSWGRVAVAGTGLADRIHVADHPMLNRADQPGAAKRARWRETRGLALAEMRAAGYEVAIDLFGFFPPAHPLFRRAGIPVRIGWTSGGFGPLLTHPVPFPDEARPMADLYRDLLDRLDPERPFAEGSTRPRIERGALPPLPAELEGAGPYLVVHPGAGSPSRHWGHDRWAAVIARLRAEAPGYRVVLTGAGAGDVALAGALAAEFPGAVNMAGSAGWDAFGRILADAALVLCPDTATGHVAALFGTPSAVIFTGTNDPARWAPWNDRLSVLVRPVVCAPCNRTGCEAMACFLGVEPDQVADAALEWLRR
jgi:ADP-heptose:LPS heptosyltransferase